MAKLFTKVEQEMLKANPYTLYVSERYIKYTVEFKRFLLNEISKPGITQKQAFRNAGYDPDILGHERIVSTVKKIRQILIRVLAENGYLDNIKADHINPVWLNPVLENAIRSNNDDRALTVFNCFL